LAKKMKVKVNTSIASADWSYAPGEEVEIDGKLANAWINSGIAGEVEEQSSIKKKSASKEKAKKGDE
jgi:hypothetical protein